MLCIECEDVVTFTEKRQASGISNASRFFWDHPAFHGDNAFLAKGALPGDYMHSFGKGVAGIIIGSAMAGIFDVDLKYKCMYFCPQCYLPK